MAIGADSRIDSGMLTEAWDGAGGWSVVPGIRDTYNIILEGVSCPESRECVAVGFQGNGRTLAAEWRGHRWKLMSTPTP